MTAPAWLCARPIAHRGLHGSAGIVENSAAAAMAAIEGRYGIECDVQLSADGEAMVFHDHALDRMTSATGPVERLSAAELKGLRLGGGKDGITPLPAFIRLIAGQVPLVVEIKSRFDGDERLARRVVELVTATDAPIAVKSFDPAIVSLLRREAPRIARGIVAQASYEGGEWDALPAERRGAMARLDHWSETEPDFISCRHLDLAGQAQAVLMPRILAGIPVIAWTIRSRAEADIALALADQIVFEGFAPA